MQRGKTPSFKMGEMLIYRSSLECDTHHLLDFDKFIKAYHYEPFRIKNDKRGAGLLPDFEAETVDGTKWLFEVKPAAKLEHPRNLEKFKFLKSWCHENGYQFGIITDVYLRSGFLLKNIRFLRRYANVVVPQTFRREIIKLLQATEIISLDKLSEMMPAEASQKIIWIYALLYHGFIVTEIKDIPISLKSWVYIVM